MTSAQEKMDLRKAIGIPDEGFEMSLDGYVELYEFDVPVTYEDFKSSCQQVAAKYPTRVEFGKVERRYVARLEAPTGRIPHTPQPPAPGTRRWLEQKETHDNSILAKTP